jgi:hypothetical protein
MNQIKKENKPILNMNKHDYQDNSGNSSNDVQARKKH